MIQIVSKHTQVAWQLALILSVRARYTTLSSNTRHCAPLDRELKDLSHSINMPILCIENLDSVVVKTMRGYLLKELF